LQRGIHTPSGSLLVIGVRHGSTEGNAKGVLRAWSDMSLDAHGKIDAQMAAMKIAPYKPKFIYSSDLTRDSQTAEIIGQKFGLPYETDFGLRTADMGEWTEQPEEEVKELTKDWYQQGFERAGGGGDTYIGFCTRFFQSFDQKLTQAECESFQPTVCCMHGRNFAALHSRYSGVAPWEAKMPLPGGVALFRYNWPDFPPITMEFISETEPILDDR